MTSPRDIRLAALTLAMADLNALTIMQEARPEACLSNRIAKARLDIKALDPDGSLRLELCGALSHARVQPA